MPSHRRHSARADLPTGAPATSRVVLPQFNPGAPEMAAGRTENILMSGFRLITPVELARRLADAAPARPRVVLEAHFTSADHPADTLLPNTHHLLSAIQVHPSYLEAGIEQAKYYPNYDCPADGNLLPDRDLLLAISKLGITPDTEVMVYGAEPAGTMAAARLVWGLMYAGVETVELLDGGIDAWRAVGGHTVPEIVTARELAAGQDRGTDTTTPWTVRREFLATTREVRGCARGSSGRDRKLVDVRRTGEWDGALTHHYPFLAQAGHIPTALHQGDWDTLIDPATRMIGPVLAAVGSRWRDLGIIDAAVSTHQTTLIFYCGTGWRSSVAFLVATLLGLRAKNYDDGFYGWSWHQERTA